MAGYMDEFQARTGSGEARVLRSQRGLHHWARFKVSRCSLFRHLNLHVAKVGNSRCRKLLTCLEEYFLAEIGVVDALLLRLQGWRIQALLGNKSKPLQSLYDSSSTDNCNVRIDRSEIPARRDPLADTYNSK